MDELIDGVALLVDKEYERASGIFGPINNSDHESAAIILEEYEEAVEEQMNALEQLQDFWKLTKVKDASDVEKLYALGKLGLNAILAASEFIQVAAMAFKASKTIEKRNEQ